MVSAHPYGFGGRDNLGERDELGFSRGTPRRVLPRHLDQAPAFIGKPTSIYGWLDAGVFFELLIEVEEPTASAVGRCLGVATFAKARYDVDDMLDAKVNLCMMGLHELRDSLIEHPLALSTAMRE